MRLAVNWLATAALSVLALTMLVGCANTPQDSHPDYVPIDPLDYYPKPPAMPPNGAIYQADHNITLFEDLRARQVGDIVTVTLAEATSGAKSSDTTLGKNSSNLIINPVLAGMTRTFGNDSNLGFDLASEHAFTGDSASNQSNQLQGSITVTVARVLPSGNLYVQGEKWIEINQGSEYIRLRGIIRPVDIAANNTILSTKVADARISYGGVGATADVNAVGWLSRFFMSPIWPF